MLSSFKTGTHLSGLLNFDASLLFFKLLYVNIYACVGE